MGRVKILSDEVISKIAAGEVIERPASVVKELVENALDAGTNSVEVYLKSAGKVLIRVKDGGSGIERDDIEKIFMRHATSKIETAGDLYSIGSLGFRGEALYSIAAVADVTLKSRTVSGDCGWEIHLRGGKKLTLKPASITAGTDIEIRELFFNTPGRRKFLKSDSAELSQILWTVIPYALIYPACRFLLTHNDRVLLDLKAGQTLVERIAACLNLKPENLLESHREIKEENVSINFVLGDTSVRRVKKDLQFIFVNGRPVQNKSINIALNLLYRDILSPGEYPFFFIDIRIPPETIDVNVHPTKREVKIRNENGLVLFLRSACSEALIPQAKPRQVKETGSVRQESGSFQFFSRTPQNPVIRETHVPYAAPAPESVPFLVSLSEKLLAGRYIGIFLNKYVLFETADSILVMDQHAAHERITYERFVEQMEAKKVESQQLLVPLLLRLNPQEMVIWEEGKGLLEEIGFSSTLWDKETIAIHSYPRLIGNSEIAVRNLLSEEDGGILIHCDKEVIARKACRQSIMAGYPVNKEEGDRLVRDLAGCKVPFTCPHGRPTVIEISGRFLDRQFFREK